MTHRFRILLELEEGKITLEEAATLLNTTPRRVKQVQTIHKDRLRIICPIIDRLMEPVNTKNDQTILKTKLAELMGINYRSLNILLKSANITLSPAIVTVERREHRKTVRDRVTKVQKQALDVIEGLSDSEDTAETLGVSRRHIYRVCGKLLKNYSMVFRDLAKMSPTKRRKLADLIEEDIVAAVIEKEKKDR